jgi:hypothetical protein
LIEERGEASESAVKCLTQRQALLAEDSARAADRRENWAADELLNPTSDD